jgi:Protein of unknown function (DUF4238)
VKKGEKHHYIPVFYLKQWRGPDGRLCEYSRPYDIVKPRRVHPDGTGYVRGLYAIDGLPPEMANVIETKLLKPADGLAADALSAFVDDRPFAKPAQMRTSWSRFVLSLMLRYPESIDEMKRQLRENVGRVYAETRKETDPPTFTEYEAAHGTDELARLHGKLLLDLMQDSRMGRLIFGMHWGIIKFSRYGHSLLTSDRPITTNAFPISANHLCLPIGPQRMFFACDTEQAEREFQQLDPEGIMRVINDRTARQAVNFVYGTDDRQLRFVENRLRRARCL